MNFTQILLLILIFSQACYAQERIELYTEAVDGGYNLYADNVESCPVSIELEFTVKSMTLTDKNGSAYILKPNSKKQFVTRLLPVPQTSHEFRYRMRIAYGDALQTEYDIDYPYSLPYSQGKEFRIDQGYNGTFSHHGEYALDFKMPEGTEVRAIRNGVVIEVVDKYNRNCLDESCEEYNNVIIIYHEDGTFADYAHLQQNGARVKKGDRVEQGQLIALSGNVGWSSAPHLHLSVFLFRFKGIKSLKTRFQVSQDGQLVFLEEGKSYFNGHK